MRGQGAYNIGFNDGDKTQFDTENLADLEELWCSFCKEEGCQMDIVDYVRTVLASEGR